MERQRQARRFCVYDITSVCVNPSPAWLQSNQRQAVGCRALIKRHSTALAQGVLGSVKGNYYYLQGYFGSPCF